MQIRRIQFNIGKAFVFSSHSSIAAKKYIPLKMKIGILAICLLIFCQFTFSQGVKEINIPNNVKVEDDVFKATFIRNLSDSEIYQYTQIHIVDDLIYIPSDKQQELFWFDFKGNLINKIGSKGQGPGSFSICLGLKAYKDNIAFMSPFDLKLVVLNKKLEFIKQIILRKSYMNFVVNNKNEFICCTMSSSFSKTYFDVYDENGDLLRQFGNVQTSPSEERRIMLSDSVDETLYLPEKDGLWARFQNRYDLQYYEKEKLIAEIKEKKGYFKAVEKEYMGRKYLNYVDKGLSLLRLEDKLYYFYLKDKTIFCDIFDLNTYKLLKRVRYKKTYGSIAHHRDNIFYSIRYNEDYEIELYKLEIEQI